MKKCLVQLILGMGLVLFTHMVSAQWVQTNVPLGMDIRALAANDSIILAGTYGNGVFLSVDNGANWTAINSGFTGYDIWSFAASGGSIFAGTDSGGVFLSANNGASWRAVNSGLTNKHVRSLAVSDSAIYAGTMRGGVFLSADNGTSWRAVNSGLTDSIIQSLALSDGTVFAGTERGVFLSDNNGERWIAGNSGPANRFVTSFAVCGGNVIAATVSWEVNRVYLSSDNGASWTEINILKGAYITSFAVHDSAIFAGSLYGGVFLSTNKGTSWTAFNSGLANSPILSLAVNGNAVFAGTGNSGVWRRPLSELTEAIASRPPRTTARQIYFRVRSQDPANRIVTIEYSLPHLDRVTVKIYNALGDEIATLVDTDQESGGYAIPWNTLNRAPGCYMVKMHSGPNTYVKSIPVLR